MLKQAKKVSLANEEGKKLIASFLGEREHAQREFPVLSEIAEHSAKRVLMADSPDERQEDVAAVKIDPDKGEFWAYINTGEKPAYTVANITVFGKNKSSGEPYREVFFFGGISKQFVKSGRWKLREEILYEYADISYMYYSRVSGMLRAGRMEKLAMSNEVDIVQEHKLLDPTKQGFGRNAGNKIYVVYNRQSSNADYSYHQERKPSDPFETMLPLGLQIWVDKAYTPLELTADESSTTYIHLSPANITYNNPNGLKLQAGEERDGKICYELTVDEKWNKAISQDKMEGEEPFLLDANIEFKDGSGKRHELMVLSTEEAHDPGYGRNFETLPIYILWGCIAKGSQVQLADGRQINIENIEYGDRICTVDKKVSEVINIYRGKEEMMRYIRVAGEKNGVLVTLDHPLMTRDGWKSAIDLREGDEIQTNMDGFIRIDEIYTQPYNDMVFSLELETGEGFWANGYAVADIMVENVYKKRKREEEKPDPKVMAELQKLIGM